MQAGPCTRQRRSHRFHRSRSVRHIAGRKRTKMRMRRVENGGLRIKRQNTRKRKRMLLKLGICGRRVRDERYDVRVGDCYFRAHSYGYRLGRRDGSFCEHPTLLITKHRRSISFCDSLISMKSTPPHPSHSRSMQTPLVSFFLHAHYTSKRHQKAKLERGFKPSTMSVNECRARLVSHLCQLRQ